MRFPGMSMFRNTLVPALLLCALLLAVLQLALLRLPDIWVDGHSLPRPQTTPVLKPDVGFSGPCCVDAAAAGTATASEGTETGAGTPVTDWGSSGVLSPTRLYLPMMAGPPSPRLLIAAAYVDSRLTGEPDEALMIRNVGLSPVSLAGWEILTGSRRATVPVTASLQLEPGEYLWCAARADAFELSFGHLPACEWEESHAAVPNLHGQLGLSNSGSVVQLRTADGVLIDTLVYGNEDRSVAGWIGPPATLYDRGAIGRAGQIFYRKQEPEGGLSKDSDRAVDWAGDLADIGWGRRVRRPGWHGWSDADMAFPVEQRVDATVSVLVGPEGLYEPLSRLLGQAVSSIDLGIYTLEHPEIAAILVAALKRGVRVRILLEGGPPGGISPLQKWCLAQIVEAGGEVRYLAAQVDAPRGYRTRYAYTHAKYGIIDGVSAFNGTDNFNRDSMPVPDGMLMGGRRGVFLITDARPVVAALSRIFAWDWAPDHFMDLRPFEATDPKYGAPPADFVLPAAQDYPVPDAPFALSVTVSGPATFAVMSAPEHALRPDAGLLGLLGRAGAGDRIHLMQLYEHKHWGAGTSNPIADPNPRLEAVIDAARRGAQVRLLLDSYFDEAENLRSNRATVAYVQALARREGLDLEARLGNPTAGGIHAKVMLLAIDAERWSAVGSLNGSESSHKLNREVVVLTDHGRVYERLFELFDHDWSGSAP